MGDQPGGHAVSDNVVVGQQVEIFGWVTNLAAMVMLTSLALMSCTQPLFNSSLGSLLLALSSTIHPTSTTSLLVLVDHHWLVVHLLLLVVILLLPLFDLVDLVVDQVVDLVVDHLLVQDLPHLPLPRHTTATPRAPLPLPGREFMKYFT